MANSLLPKARKDKLHLQEMSDETIVYDTRSDRAHVLNGTASLVYTYANGKRTPAEIARLVGAALRTPVTEETVWFALAQLSKSGLLEAGAEPPKEWLKMTRRDFLRTSIGAAAFVPIVMSMRAPAPSVPVSCVGLNGVCTEPGQCCLGLRCDLTTGCIMEG
jgi:hypothetical protein